MLFNIQKASIGKYRSHAIRYSCPIKLFLNSFLDTTDRINHSGPQNRTAFV